jgi:hypothetical protein
LAVTIFDPGLMRVNLSSKGAVREWRARLGAHLLRTRPWRCDCCGEVFFNRVDVHEGIVTKGDVRGWRLPQRAWIFSEYNCILLLRAHHHPLKRQFVWDLQCKRYGEAAMREWYESLPFKVLPRRFWE